MFEQPPLYNSVAGIETYLTDLAGLNRLVQDRHEATYERKERLDQFIILGHWATDSCGNFGPVEFLDANYKPRQNAGSSLPRAIRTEDRVKYGLDTMYMSFAHSIPPERVFCPECNKPWTIENAHDCHVVSNTEKVDLTQWLGLTVQHVHAEFQNRRDRQYRLGIDRALRNDRYIDLTPDQKFPTLKINEHGWVDAHPEHVIEEGDEASFYVWTYYHKRCHRLRVERLERQEFEGIFQKASLERAVLNEIPNEYCPCAVCGPWFIARLPFGDIKIGWRKRVINIEWSSTGRDLTKLFEKEEVTKGPDFIHAWGREKAIDYLSRIRLAFT